MRLLHFLTLGLCVGIISGLMFLDDPLSWSCRGKKPHRVDLLQKVMKHCKKQASVCRDMCALQHTFVVTKDFTFDETEARKALETFMPDAVGPTLAGLVACTPKLHEGNQDQNCPENSDYVKCVHSVFQKNCKLSRSAFRYKKGTQRNVVYVDRGYGGGNYMNGGLLGALFQGIFG